MNRLTTDKKTKDMTMVELAHNSCVAKNHEAWYRDYEREISARDLVREVMLAQGLCNRDDIEMHDNEVFDEVMVDYLSSPPKELEGLVALLYRNLWAMANLRERLKSYEDKGPIRNWIPCRERLPVESINPLTQSWQNYQVTVYFSSGAVDIRTYSFGAGHWWHGPQIMDEYVKAWLPNPVPYREDGESDGAD